MLHFLKNEEELSSIFQLEPVNFLRNCLEMCENLLFFLFFQPFIRRISLIFGWNGTECEKIPLNKNIFMLTSLRRCNILSPNNKKPGCVRI